MQKSTSHLRMVAVACLFYCTAPWGTIRELHAEIADFETRDITRSPSLLSNLPQRVPGGVHITAVPRAASASGQAAPNRDEIEYENRVRFLRQAIASARQARVKKEALALNARLSLERFKRLSTRSAISEMEVRLQTYRAVASKLEVEEQDFVIKELLMDSEIAELNRRWSTGELEDLVAIAEYHHRRWVNAAELNRIVLKRARAYQEWTDWHLQSVKTLAQKKAVSQEEVDLAILESSISQAEFDSALLRISEAEKSADESLATVEKLKTAPVNPS